MHFLGLIKLKSIESSVLNHDSTFEMICLGLILSRAAVTWDIVLEAVSYVALSSHAHVGGVLHLANNF